MQNKGFLNLGNRLQQSVEEILNVASTHVNPFFQGSTERDGGISYGQSCELANGWIDFL
jgi:hypothetical protein